MGKYKSKQTAYFIVIPVLAAALLASWALMVEGFTLGAIVLAVVLLLTALGFSSLTITVDDQYIKLKFGIGFYKRKFPLAGIKSASSMRIPFWYGWGIHWVFNGWVYNVSGFQAVEIIYESGKRVVIGSNEPKKLVEAIGAGQQ